MSKYEMVVGLEIHVQTKTRSKMFCSCDAAYFQAKPNSHVCPVCLGLPGALPVPNAIAIEKCVKLALALNCKINQESKFDRKNYFYPDLPKGYQISQYDLPFGENGYLEYDLNGDSIRIRIKRVHQEEDTGKSIHEGAETLLDYNKSGVPLAEIVTEPDFTDVKEIDAFAKRLKQIVRYLDISNADMEKGQMRFELNISLRKSGSKTLPPYKVEVKNIGSISVLEKVINYEFDRQAKLLDNNETPLQETRGIKDMSGKTYSQRVKENSDDYRYFPEPDIPPILISDEMITRVKEEMVELPQQRKDRYMHEYKLEPSTAETIIATKARSDWFEQAITRIDDKELIKEIAKWYIGDLFALMKANKIKLNELKLSAENFVGLVKMLYQKKISGSIAKQILPQILDGAITAETYAKEHDLLMVQDENALEEVIMEVIKQNPKVVATLDKNPNVIKFLIGQVMRITKGKADPKLSEQLLKKHLQS
ncbi:MAG TPA: Asp-tRNA(Asn)/Glu-tRNA(Gln) amidotransferase subunit GatB [Candidatus Dojkabacteria bacterium]|nr:Asp-tRNA(Asn)/Glu-tRNA(Gln) amidotransferase subunit GatB [Candidatus Dojkabacteria bacterium]